MPVDQSLYNTGVKEPSTQPFVSRGGIKLAAALDAFGLDVSGFVCADLGCNVGGFTDCLLKRGAARVYAMDTGYGSLAWGLRNDPRVVVMERTNAMHVEAPVGCVDLVVVDLGWTKQRHAIPAALRWNPGQIVTLVKPHYESPPERGGVHGAEESLRVFGRVKGEMAGLGVRVVGEVESPILGGGGKGRAGNREYLLWLHPVR